MEIAMNFPPTRHLYRWGQRMAFALVALGFAAFAIGQTLTVAVSTPVASVTSEAEVTLTLTWSNLSQESIRIPKVWVVPELADAAFVRVKREGRELPYLGPLVKRDSTPAATLTLAPGSSMQRVLVVSQFFDMRAAGLYEVMIDAAAFGTATTDAAISTQVTIAANPNRLPLPDPLVTEKLLVQGETRYLRSCTAPQRDILTAVLREARRMADESSRYFLQPVLATTRYAIWFGAFTPAHAWTVQQNFAAIRKALRQAKLTFDCGCNASDTYAYVYRARPYRIHLCGKFWQAPRAGVDSAAGTLIHEVSHFTEVANTEDFVYGQVAAKALARRNPTKAIANADTYEYFAERAEAR
jgi:peptidyl-Lys metalloendopeptidase